MQAVADPPQESLVDQVMWVEVGGKYEELLKWKLDLFSRMQGEVIHPIFQGNDPAVQQVAWSHALPPEVVDDEDPVIGFDLEGSFVVIEVLRVYQIHRIQRQLPPPRQQGGV